MKRSSLLCLICIFLSAPFVNAETINLSYLQYVRIPGGLIVIGMDNSNGNTLHAYRYDKKLNRTSEYSNSYPAAQKYGIGAIWQNDDIITITIACKGKCTDYHLCLTTELKEVSNNERSPEDEKSANTEADEKGYYYQSRKFMFATGDDPFDHNFIGKDWINMPGNQSMKLLLPEDYPMNQPVIFAPGAPKAGEHTSIRRSEPVGTTRYPRYKTKWETQLEEESVVMSDIACYDESSIFAVAMTGKEGKIWGTYFYYLDAKTGQLKKKVQITPAEPNTGFYFTKGFYDAEKQKVILIGNLLGSEIKKKESFKVLNIAVFTFDLKTKEMTEKTTELTDLSSFDYKPISFKEQFPVIRQITKSKSGGYNVAVEILAKRDQIGRIVPVGLSTFEISESGNCSPRGSFLYNIKEIAAMDGSQTYVKYLGTTSDGRGTLVSIVYKRQHYARLITFANGSAQETNLENSGSDPEKDNEQKDFLLDDHTVLILKKIEKDQWEINTHEF
ncbi:MAG: hypothetical protein ACJ77K_14475 [Bacteroidia bacterium]